MVEQVVCRCGELNAPQPSQHIRRKHGDSGSSGHARQRLLRARLTMCKLVSANDDGNQAGDFGYGASEERLQGGEAGIKGRTALGVGCERN